MERGGKGSQMQEGCCGNGKCLLCRRDGSSKQTVKTKPERPQVFEFPWNGPAEARPRTFRNSCGETHPAPSVFVTRSSMGNKQSSCYTHWPRNLPRFWSNVYICFVLCGVFSLMMWRQDNNKMLSPCVGLIAANLYNQKWTAYWWVAKQYCLASLFHRCCQGSILNFIIQKQALWLNTVTHFASLHKLAFISKTSIYTHFCSRSFSLATKSCQRHQDYRSFLASADRFSSFSLLCSDKRQLDTSGAPSTDISMVPLLLIVVLWSLLHCTYHRTKINK